MYLLDASAIITPFHRAQCGSLSLALRHNNLDETYDWLKHWFEYGFSSGNLVITREVYEEVVEKGSKKVPRIEREMLKNLYVNGQIIFPHINDDFSKVLAEIDVFARSNYEPHQAETFLKKADPELVALAKAHGFTLAAEEHHFIPQRDGANNLIKGEPRLPFIAATFKVKCKSIMAIMLSEHYEWGQAQEKI